MNALSYGNGLITWRERKTVKGYRGELAKDPTTVKLVFSLEHKDSE